MKRRFTPAQKRALAVLQAGYVLRKRGAFGGYPADKRNPEWPDRRTVECLLRDGLIEAGDWCGTYVLKR